MKITEHKITVADLCKNYKDDGDDGVYAYDGKLTVRPAYQRENRGQAYGYSQKDPPIHGRKRILLTLYRVLKEELCYAYPPTRR